MSEGKFDAKDSMLVRSREVLGFDSGFRIKPGTPQIEVDDALVAIDTIPSDQLDLRTRDGIAIFMLQSNNEPEWKEKTELVKMANGGQYPSFWFSLITGGDSAITGQGIVEITKKKWNKKAYYLRYFANWEYLLTSILPNYRK